MGTFLKSLDMKGIYSLTNLLTVLYFRAAFSAASLKAASRHCGRRILALRAATTGI
jgi:hypothetical protein